MPSPTKVMLIEDSPEYREVVELSLAKDSELTLVAKFGAAEIALRKLQDTHHNDQPDVILLDLKLPGMNGNEAIQWIHKYAPKAKILVLTQSDREADVLKALSLGASGYLLKESTVKQIKDAIHSIVNGSSLIDANVAKYITQAIQNKSKHVPLEKPLSDRELEILTLIGEGLQKKEIAQKLNIGPGTVKTHTLHIYKKLQVENAPAAVNRGHQLGLFPTRP